MVVVVAAVAVAVVIMIVHCILQILVVTHLRSVVRKRVSTGMALWPVRVTGDAGLGGSGCAKASSEGLEVM